MKNYLGPAIFTAALLLAACGGGGGNALDNSGTSVSLPIPGTVATPPSTALATAAPGQTLLSVFVNHRSAAANSTTLPPLTSIIADINTLNGSNQIPAGNSASTTQALNASQNCTSPAPCTVLVSAPAGSLNITVTAYAGTNPVSTTTQTYTSTGAAGQTQTVTLSGIVSAVAFTTPTLTLGTPQTTPLTLTISDPSGATVVDGSYANPFTLTDTESSTATELQLGTGGLAKTVTSTQPSDTVNFVYNGAAYAPFKINAATTTYQYAK